MDLRRIGLERLFGIEHEGQGLVLDFDELQSVLGDLFGVGDDAGDFVADVAHDLIEEKSLASERDLWSVLRAEHGAHAGESFSFASVNLFDLGVRVRAAQDLAVEHPRQLHISCVERFPGDALRAINSGRAFAHESEGSLRLPGLQPLALDDHVLFEDPALELRLRLDNFGHI
jgi:hypothetical protein